MNIKKGQQIRKIRHRKTFSVKKMKVQCQVSDNCWVGLLFHTVQLFIIFFNLWFFTEIWVTTNLLRSPGLLRILADFYSAVVWMVPVLPLINILSCLFSRFWRLFQLWSVSLTPSCSLAGSRYFSRSSSSFILTQSSAGIGKSTRWRLLLIQNQLLSSGRDWF